MSFLGFPPEVNSGMIYTGPGSAPLLAAASAWDGLASELTSTAHSVSSVVSGLHSSWQGLSGGRAVGATEPYVSWLHATAAQAATIGQQAKQAAALFDAAHSGSVPPAVIEANRTLLLTLISTNFFGQNTPAISATESQYMEFWAQDGATMDTYMASSQSNSDSLQKPSDPPQVTSHTGQDQASSLGAQDPSQHANSLAANGNQGGGDGGSSSGSGNGGGAGDGSGGLIPGGADNPAAGLQALYYPALFASLPLRMLLPVLMQLARLGSMGGATAGLAGASSGGGSEALMASIGQFVDGKLQGAVGTLAGHFSSATSAISAKLGNAASMGALKVPEAWSAAASGVTRAAPVLPNAAASAPSLASSTFPGGPFGQALMGALSGRGLSSVAAKAPKVIPKPSAGG